MRIHDRLIMLPKKLVTKFSVVVDILTINNVGRGFCGALCSRASVISAEFARICRVSTKYTWRWQTAPKLQRVLNCCSRVIFGGNSCQLAIMLLRDHLHRLWAREHISFKLSILVYKAIHGLASWYRNEMCIPVSTVPNLSALRSAVRGDLVVPRTRLQLGNRAFCVAGPIAWNSLPLDIRRLLLYQRSKTCSRHTYSPVSISLTNCFQSMSSELCTAIYVRR